MKKTPLKRQSPKRAKWQQRYSTRKLMDFPKQSCAWCNKIGSKDSFERHHPFGRLNERILAYVYLCHSCHETVHDFGKASNLTGWIQPEFRGMPRIQRTIFPWKKECELNWPDNLKRENL